MQPTKAPKRDIQSGDVLEDKARGTHSDDTTEEVPQPPDNPSKKPPMYADNSSGAGDTQCKNTAKA